MYDKLMWVNDNTQYILRDNIVEYDMEAASLSVSERYNLLPKRTIEEMKLLPKDTRSKRMGCMQRDDPEFSKKMLECLREARQKFIDANRIEEGHILSLHSDAIFFTQKHPVKADVDGIHFNNKNVWTSYILYKGIEMYYADGLVTYKNIPKELVQQHTLGINQYLCTIFAKLEDYDASVTDYMVKFQQKYLQDNLPEYYYLPFGRGKAGSVKIANLDLFGFLAQIVINEVEKW